MVLACCGTRRPELVKIMGEETRMQLELAKEESIIKLEGYKAKCVLTKDYDGTRWVVEIPDTDRSSVTVLTFPDVLPN